MAVKKVAVKKAAVAPKVAVAAAVKKAAPAAAAVVKETPAKAIVNFDAEAPARFLNQNNFSIAKLRSVCDCSGLEDEQVKSHVETQIRYGKVTEQDFN